MNELRLLPAALLTWAAVAGICLGWHPAMIVLGVVLLALVAAWWWPAEALTAGAVACGVALLAMVRRHRAGAFPQPKTVAGTLVSPSTPMEFGGALWRLDIAGLPVPLRAMSPDATHYPTGTQVIAEVTYRESKQPGIAEVSAQVTRAHLSPPQGIAAWVAQVRADFREVVQATVGESSQGLIPGMVLGDTSLQTPQWQERFATTGLSHLSAVSGANVAIVLSVAVIACALLGLGPRIQVASCGVLLIGFVALVGLEPSVLRAATMGSVGLLAVLASRRLPPIHGLACAIISLVAYDSELAVNWGFTLSVAATAGIVALSPLLYRLLASYRMPEVLTRALAVALAADCVTLPIVAAMTGRASLVSVVANVLVAGAVAPVTVMGLIAVALAPLWPVAAGVVLQIIEPASWWIATVAHRLAEVPFVTVEASPLAVIVVYGWLGYALLSTRGGGR